MKILLVTETLNTGGAETFVVRLANELSKEHTVAIAVLYGNLVNHGIMDQVEDNVKLYYINLKGLLLKHKVDSLLRKLQIDCSWVQTKIQKKLIQVINEFRPDVLHSHLFKCDYTVAKVIEHIPFEFKKLTTIHGDYSSFYNSEANARMLHVKKKMKKTLSTMQQIVCLSEEHTRFFANHFSSLTSRISLIYNGFKPNNNDYLKLSKEDLQLPQHKMIFGMVSRGVEKKGWKKAIDAFVAANLSNAALVLVGSGDYLNKLAAEITHPNIIFAGYCKTPVMYIQHFDVCLLPSLFHYETLPTVVMEYLYCGKPVIATDVGEISKMITAENALLAGDLLDFEDYDIKTEQLKKLMQRYYNDRQYLIEKQKNAHAAFEKFDMIHCTQQYYELYKR
jgi:glycosyltransferase involved in cell wall biosynthesis